MLNWLKASYFIGGLYDTSLGLGIIFLRTFLSRSFHIKDINVPVIADALGLFLIGYGILLIHESILEKQQISIGLVSACIRFAYVVFVLYYVIFMQIEWFYIVLALTDFLTGLFIMAGIVIEKEFLKTN